MLGQWHAQLSGGFVLRFVVSTTRPMGISWTMKSESDQKNWKRSSIQEECPTLLVLNFETPRPHPTKHAIKRSGGRLKKNARLIFFFFYLEIFWLPRFPTRLSVLFYSPFLLLRTISVCVSWPRFVCKCIHRAGSHKYIMIMYTHWRIKRKW